MIGFSGGTDHVLNMESKIFHVGKVDRFAICKMDGRCFTCDSERCLCYPTIRKVSDEKGRDWDMAAKTYVKHQLNLKGYKFEERNWIPLSNLTDSEKGAPKCYFSKTTNK